MYKTVSLPVILYGVAPGIKCYGKKHRSEVFECSELKKYLDFSGMKWCETGEKCRVVHFTKYCNGE